jgi:hypothetical protein
VRSWTRKLLRHLLCLLIFTCAVGAAVQLGSDRPAAGHVRHGLWFSRPHRPAQLTRDERTGMLWLRAWDARGRSHRCQISGAGDGLLIREADRR